MNDVVNIKANKPPIYAGVIAYFPRAIEALALLSQAGANKHGHQLDRDGVINEQYTLRMWDDAAGRHQLAYTRGELVDTEMRSLHRTNEVWCKMAALEKILYDGDRLDDLHLQDEKDFYSR